MNKSQWLTLMFALEEVIQNTEREFGRASDHAYETLKVAAREMENAND